MYWNSCVYWCVLTSLCSLAVGQETEFKEQPLPPLKRVVFYNSGVAHMQHRGKVTGKTLLPIRFSAHAVDDVLKSLIFEDQGGGNVRAVEYQPAPNPEDVAANDFGPMTLAQLLQKYRGEKVTIVSQVGERADEEKGTIFGLENRQIGQDMAEVLVLIDEESGMRSLRLNEIFRVNFDNKEVQKEMTLAMTGITKSRKANQKQLDMLFDGQGEREVGFAYVVDAPIWRMSYRLSVTPEQVQLQGWTHINNVTGVDWNNVTVELRSGQPQAFHAELFAPVLAERESVGLNPFGLPEELTLVRQWYGFEPAPRFGEGNAEFGGGMGGSFGGGMMGGGMGGMGGGPFGGGGGTNSTNKSTAGDGIDTNTAFQQIAALDRTGTTVRFKLDKPVDLASGKSAALPVFQQKLPSRLLSVVKHHESSEQLTAVQAIELTNATEYSLVPGPITVSRGGDFVGDAQIARLPIGSTALLPYSVDRAIRVKREESERTRTTESIELRGKQIVTTLNNGFDVHFKIDNQDKDPRLMVIEYKLPNSLPVSMPKQRNEDTDPFDDSALATELETTNSGNKRLTITPSPKKTEGTLATYEVPAPALKVTDFSVLFRWSEQRSQSLRNVSSSQAASWIRSSKVNVSTKAKLQELVKISNAIVKNQNLMMTLTSKKNQQVKEQERVRENLIVLGSGTAAAEPFLKRINETETAIRELDSKIQELEAANEQRIRERNAL